MLIITTMGIYLSTFRVLFSRVHENRQENRHNLLRTTSGREIPFMAQLAPSW